MEQSEYKVAQRVQDRHWMWLGRTRIVKNVIERQIDLSHKLRIADIGCGSGSNIPLLLQYGSVTGFEPFQDCVAYLNEKFGRLAEFIRFEIPDEFDPHRRFDLMVLADVFEHIQDGASAVKWFYEHLEDRGYLLITVPAHPALWTETDEASHHYHRYTKKTLFALLRQNQFKIVFFSYYNLILFPVKLAFVAYDRMKRLLRVSSSKSSHSEIPPFPINDLFKSALYFEAAILRQNVSLPFGVNLVVLAQKRFLP